MTPSQPRIVLEKTEDYRESYANSVQLRASLWDFFLLFGRVDPSAGENVNIRNFQGVYLSPQQAKALLGVLQQHVGQYEASLGEIRLEAHTGPGFIQ
jgi:flagellar protein FlaG